ncbi:MAG: hypothetical protein R3E18_06335 [Sphingomonadaceae bacterium]|nr:hypothetical protein [Sphingomonadaceae bacterium]
MKTLTRIAAPALAATLALGLAAPASAQRYDGNRDAERGWTDSRPAPEYRANDRGYRADRRDARFEAQMRAEIRDLGQDIRQAERRNLIGYAPELKVQFRLLKSEFERMDRRGYNPAEKRWLTQKTASLRRSLEVHIAQAERRNRFAYRDTVRPGRWQR